MLIADVVVDLESMALSGSSPNPEILVVEDDRLLRQMTVETLAAEGLVAIGVDNAGEGLTTLDAHPGVKLLITDINMPGMNGFELLSLVRAKHPGIKLMAFSGRAHLADGSLPQSAKFLAKPFTAHQLMAQVESALAEISGTATPAER